MTSLLLLRHAESEWNQEGRFQGWADPPLSASGQHTARTWATRAGLHFDAVASSDLIRSRVTAEAIAHTTKAGGVDLRPRLREQDQGAWTGLTKAEVKRRWPQLARQRPREPYGGETQAQLTDRVMAELEDLTRRYAGGTVLVVTHAGVIKAVERALGCGEAPVPHLGGRWIEEAGARHWVAGPAVPHSRNLQPIGVDDAPEGIR